MNSEHDQTEHDQPDAGWYREQLDIALTALQACDAALKLANDRLEHGIGYRVSDAARVFDAREALNGLLRLPTDRPGSWEAQHVEALQEPLRDVLHALDGGDQ